MSILLRIQTRRQRYDLDAKLASGAAPDASTELGLRADQLMSTSEREHIATGIAQAVAQAVAQGPPAAAQFGPLPTPPRPARPPVRGGRARADDDPPPPARRRAGRRARRRDGVAAAVRRRGTALSRRPGGCPPPRAVRAPGARHQHAGRGRTPVRLRGLSRLTASTAER